MISRKIKSATATTLFFQFAVLSTFHDYFMAQKSLFSTKTRKIPKKIVIVELMWKRDYKHKNVNNTHQYYFFALPIDNAILLPKYYYVIISLQKLHASTCTPVSYIYKRRLYKIINHEAVTFVFFEKDKKDTVK